VVRSCCWLSCEGAAYAAIYICAVGASVVYNPRLLLQVHQVGFMAWISCGCM
jgi:hypothetical protein